MDSFGENIVDEFECPLLSMTETIYCVQSVHISHSVSVIHQCTRTCKFTTRLASKTIEHEKISSSELCYQHDKKNRMYSLNVYCLNH